MLAWLANLDFAGGGAIGGGGAAELLHGTRQTLAGVGCWAACFVAAVGAAWLK